MSCSNILDTIAMSNPFADSNPFEEQNPFSVRAGAAKVCSGAVSSRLPLRFGVIWRGIGGFGAAWVWRPSALWLQQCPFGLRVSVSVCVCVWDRLCQDTFVSCLCAVIWCLSRSHRRVPALCCVCVCESVCVFPHVWIRLLACDRCRRGLLPLFWKRDVCGCARVSAVWRRIRHQFCQCTYCSAVPCL